MEAALTNLILMLILIVAVVIMIIMWRRNKKMKRQIKKLRKGKNPLSMYDKFKIAVGLKKPPRPPHGGFKQGDVNIRVW